MIERLLGNNTVAEEYDAKAKAATQNLLSGLWLRELGRPAYLRDELGHIRPEGQYYTLILPVYYGLLNALDSWTSIRHLRDRLTGPSGEIYYSNNFPNHISGVKSSPYSPTWGPQAGAYMQSWGTWGLNRVGLRNEAYRPLQVGAKWAMMFPHLGAWPESSTEFTPAYFANTAANYAQSVIEGLFGLELDIPRETLRIQPAFPDHWPTASISLAQAQANYKREGNRLTYDITTGRLLKRDLKWALPVSRIESVTVNGQTVRFTIEPGVNGVWLKLTTEALKNSKIVVEFTPVNWKASYPQSIAEGQSMKVMVSGCEVVGIDDPTGVTAGIDVTSNGAKLRMATGLLDRWLEFGRLGQLNFSRRSTFLKCKAQGQPFWAALDFTLLPPFEVAPGLDLSRAGSSYELEVTLRNNTNELLEGDGYVQWAGRSMIRNMNVAARSEKKLRIAVPPEMLLALTPGDNSAKLCLPNGIELQLRFPVAVPFKDNPSLHRAAAVNTRTIELPAESLVEDSKWKEFAAFPVFYQGPWNSLPPPLEAVSRQSALRCDAIPGIEFPLKYGRKLALASRRLGRPKIEIDLDQKLRKIYLVLLPLVESHDIFTRCGAVTITCDAKPDMPPFDAAEEPIQWTKARYPQMIIRRTLTTPGDLDSFFSEYLVGPFATARLERPTRYGLLPLLNSMMGLG